MRCCACWARRCWCWHCRPCTCIKRSAGRLGLVAFFVALLGTTLMVSSDWFELFAGPPLEELIPGIAEQPPTAIVAGFVINFVTESLGWLLFGIATHCARVFPRATALVLIVGVLLIPVGPVWITMVWNGAIVGMGAHVLGSRGGLEPTLTLEAA